MMALRQLQTLIDLQGYDTRIAALEAEAARLPKQIEAIQASLAEAQEDAGDPKAKIDAGRKDLRAKEKDLEVVAAKRTKQEARLYEVKTNKEYSAVLLEIEEIKQEKAKIEEEILVLMELQERLAATSARPRCASRPARSRGARTRPSCARSWPSSSRS